MKIYQNSENWFYRKWTVKDYPKLVPKTMFAIENKWLCTTPLARIQCNINSMKNENSRGFYNIEILSGVDVIKFMISEEQYDKIADAIPYKPLIIYFKKYLWKNPVDGKEYLLQYRCVDESTETSIFHVYIDFNSKEEAEAFVPPDFFGEEIDDFDAFNSFRYWQMTRLGIPPKITRCQFTPFEDDQNQFYVNVVYDYGRKERLFSTKREVVPWMQEKQFIGLTRSEALEVPFNASPTIVE